MSSQNESKEVDGNANVKPSVADDWECATEDIQIAQIAERQKQIAQCQVEAEQLKFGPSTSSTDNIDEDLKPNPVTFDPLGGRPIRLLRRPENSSRIKGNAADNQKNTKSLTLEEREAAYQQARNRIFGNSTNTEKSDEDLLAKAVNGISVHDVDTATVEGGGSKAAKDLDESTPTTDDAGEAKLQPPARNYLSDVEMVTGGGVTTSQPPPYYSRRGVSGGGGGVTRSTGAHFNPSTNYLQHPPPPIMPLQGMAPPPNLLMASQIPLQPLSAYAGGPPPPITLAYHPHHPPPLATCMAGPPVTAAWPALPGQPPLAFPMQLPPNTSPQYGQPPGFAAGYLPPQSIFQGGWWTSPPATMPAPKQSQSTAQPHRGYNSVAANKASNQQPLDRRSGRKPEKQSN